MTFIERVYKQSIIILIPLSIISAFIDWKKLPISIIIGGILGLLNLGGLARGVGSFLGASKVRATIAVIFSSFLRLTALAFILAILFIYKLVNALGILIGFTIVFIVILKEGLRVAKKL